VSVTAKAFWVIFPLAAAVRLTLVFGFHHYQIGRPEPIRIAISLAANGSFADPYAIPTGPTAHNPPLYPILIAPLYAFWGNTRTADFARFALNALAASAEYALLPLVASALGLGLWPGILAGLGGALIPLQLWPECMGDFETTWIALFLELVTILFVRFLRAPRLDSKCAARWGLLWGVGLLLAPSVLPVLVGFCAIGGWKLRPAAGVAGRWLTVFSATVLLVLAPWFIRNYIQLGGVFFVRDEFALELSNSNHDGASPDATENMAQAYYAAEHPQFNVAVAREIQRTGELAFERRKLRQALAWIRGNPRKFASLTMGRIWTFWFARMPRFRWVFWTATASAFAGLALLSWYARLTAALLATILASYSAVYCLIQSTLRYQHPVWWIQVLLIGWMVYYFGMPVSVRNPIGRRLGSRGRDVRLLTIL
jgi:FtsH-binding integral membrane protein